MINKTQSCLILEQIRQAVIIWYFGQVQLNINPQSEGLLLIVGEQIADLH